jgi:pimeloyl-ACP methyl ester carboxylesterase
VLIVVVTVLTAVCALAAFVLWNPFWVADQAVSAYLWARGVHSGYVMVDGHRIHYLDAKPGDDKPDRPLLLVHGLGARAWDWAPLIPGLVKNGYHVYALDLLGYGQSPKPLDGDFSLAVEERITRGYMQAMGLKRADIAGWSMGGWVALKIALDAPETVRRLVLYDSAGLYFPLDFPLTTFSPRDRTGLNELVRHIEPDKPHIQIPGFAVPGMLRRFRRSRFVVESSVRSMLTGRELLDFRVHELKMPVLIVWGTEDHLTPFGMGERLHELIPQSILVGLEGCGHLAPAECWEEVLPTTVQFLDADPPMQPLLKIREEQPGR